MLTISGKDLTSLKVKQNISGTVHMKNLFPNPIGSEFFRSAKGKGS